MENIHILPKSFQYALIPGLKHIGCRAVIMEGKPSGEYHIKLIDKSLSLNDFIQILSGMIENASISIIDPDNLLNLEYPISIRIDSLLGQESIEESLKEVDNYLERRCHG